MDDGQAAVTVSDLVREHYQLVYRYAYRLTGSSADAEDLTQQAFLTAQLKLNQLRDRANAKAWLCTILRNDYLKRLRGRRSEHSLERLPEPEQQDDRLGFEFDEERLQAALDELPEEFRSPLILFYFEEFSYKEIAAQLGVPMGTVMSRLARAKTYLRRRLSQGGAPASPSIAPARSW